MKVINDKEETWKMVCMSRRIRGLEGFDRRFGSIGVREEMTRAKRNCTMLSPPLYDYCLSMGTFKK